jgi:hypothetical protein
MSSQDCVRQNVCFLSLIVGRKGNNHRISNACSFSTRGMHSTCTSVLSMTSGVGGEMRVQNFPQLMASLTRDTCSNYALSFAGFASVKHSVVCTMVMQEMRSDCSRVLYTCRNRWRPTGHQVQRVSTGSPCMSAARWGPR